MGEPFGDVLTKIFPSSVQTLNNKRKKRKRKRKRNKGTKAIIVKFVSHKVKTQLYGERTKLKNVKISDLFPSATSATRAEATRIFLNENLTSYRRKIVSRANEMRKAATFESPRVAA